jgi:circadian clock protein KaiB
MPKFEFTLFVAGESPRSHLAAVNLRRLGDERLGGDYRLDIVDVVRHPERAEAERILTTPTLIKLRPEPSRRVTGDLSDPELVIVALALHIDRGIDPR